MTCWLARDTHCPVLRSMSNLSHHVGRHAGTRLCDIYLRQQHPRWDEHRGDLRAVKRGTGGERLFQLIAFLSCSGALQEQQCRAPGFAARAAGICLSDGHDHRHVIGLEEVNTLD
jgi:hypothetical protein